MLGEAARTLRSAMKFVFYSPGLVLAYHAGVFRAARAWEARSVCAG